MNDPSRESPVVDAVGRAADAVGQLIHLQFELTKAEVSRDAGKAARDVAPLLVAAPLVGVGYVFACVAAALGLAPWVGVPGGLAMVAGANALLAAIALSFGRAGRR